MNSELWIMNTHAKNLVLWIYFTQIIWVSRRLRRIRRMAALLRSQLPASPSVRIPDGGRERSNAPKSVICFSLRPANACAWLVQELRFCAVWEIKNTLRKRNLRKSAESAWNKTPAMKENFAWTKRNSINVKVKKQPSLQPDKTFIRLIDIRR